jgi:hypothetical protein
VLAGGVLVTAAGVDAGGGTLVESVGNAAVVGAVLIGSALVGAAAVVGAALVVTGAAGALACAGVLLGARTVVAGRLALTEGTLALGTEGLRVGVGRSTKAGIGALTVGDRLTSDVPLRVASAPAGAAIIQTTVPRPSKAATTRLAIPRRDARRSQRHSLRMPKLPQNSPSSPLRTTQRGSGCHVTVEIYQFS